VPALPTFVGGFEVSDIGQLLHWVIFFKKYRSGPTSAFFRGKICVSTLTNKMALSTFFTNSSGHPCPGTDKNIFGFFEGGG
jgi:hypothetical protein